MSVHGESALTASWSPAGKHLISAHVINGRLQLAIIDMAADKVEATIQTNGSAILPTWSHGRRIAYVLMDTGNPGEIHTIRQSHPSRLKGDACSREQRG